MKSLLPKIALLCSLLLTPSAFAKDPSFSILDPYQETLTKAEVESALALMMGDEFYVRSYLHITDAGLGIYKDASRSDTHYLFRFGNKSLPQSIAPFTTTPGGSLSGLKLALNARDTASTHVVEQIKSLVIAKGAKAQDVLISRKKGLRDINDEINGFRPDITLAIQNQGSHFIGFVPGCFMDGELEESRFRLRLIHALVSAKATNSLKLAQTLATRINNAFGKSPLPMHEHEFENSACGIPFEGSFLPNVATRNLFINGVLAPAVVFAFTGVPVSIVGAQTIAQAYVDGIIDYVTSSPDRTEL